MNISSKDIKNGIIVIAGLLLFRWFTSTSNDSDTFPHLQFLDNPEQFKGKTFNSNFYYRQFQSDGRAIQLGDLNKLVNSKEFDFIDGDFIEFQGYRYSKGIDNKLEMSFELPKGLTVPNVSDNDEIIIEFKCNEGKHDSGNSIISVKRPE